MDKHDLKFIKEAIEWANDCHRVKESIPGVGAIFAVGHKALGRGRRGTGKEGSGEGTHLLTLRRCGGYWLI